VNREATARFRAPSCRSQPRTPTRKRCARKARCRELRRATRPDRRCALDGRRGSTVIMPDALLDEVTGWSNGRSSSRARSIRRSCRAAGMPDPHDAAEPEVFRAGRRDGKLVPRFLVVGNVERATRQRSSKATSGCCGAARRCALLLRPGPQDALERAFRELATSSITTSSARSSSASRASRGSPAMSPT
jgi:hypothetical protein